MFPGITHEPAFTVSREFAGLSARHPVRISSWIDEPGAPRRVRPEDPDFPGWDYGDHILAPERQKHDFHDHDYYEICIVRKGCAVHRTGFANEELKPGTVIVMAPGMVHAIYGAGGLWQTNLYYLVEWLSDDLSAYWNEIGMVPLFLATILFRCSALAQPSCFSLNAEEMAAVRRELADIGAESVADPPSQTFLRASLVKLLIVLSRSYVRQSPDGVGLRIREEIREAIRRIEETIQRSDLLHVSDLARGIGLSASHLSEVFRESTGWSPMEYFQRRRAQHASRLLLDMDRTVTGIAHALGYVDGAHLCHQFQRYYGMSPSAYRAIHRGSGPAAP